MCHSYGSWAPSVHCPTSLSTFTFLSLSTSGKAVTHALAKTLAKPVDEANSQAGRHQANTHDAQRYPLYHQQVDPQG